MYVHRNFQITLPHPFCMYSMPPAFLRIRKLALSPPRFIPANEASTFFPDQFTFECQNNKLMCFQGYFLQSTFTDLDHPSRTYFGGHGIFVSKDPRYAIFFTIFGLRVTPKIFLVDHSLQGSWQLSLWVTLRWLWRWRSQYHSHTKGKHAQYTRKIYDLGIRKKR